MAGFVLPAVLFYALAGDALYVRTLPDGSTEGLGLGYGVFRRWQDQFILYL